MELQKQKIFIHQIINRNPAIANQKSEIPQSKNPQSEKLFDATSIWFTFQAMEEVMRPGEEGLWQQFNFITKDSMENRYQLWFQGWMGNWVNAKICSSRVGWQYRWRRKAGIDWCANSSANYV